MKKLISDKEAAMDASIIVRMWRVRDMIGQSNESCLEMAVELLNDMVKQRYFPEHIVRTGITIKGKYGVKYKLTIKAEEIPRKSKKSSIQE